MITENQIGLEYSIESLIAQRVYADWCHGKRRLERSRHVTTRCSSRYASVTIGNGTQQVFLVWSTLNRIEHRPEQLQIGSQIVDIARIGHDGKAIEKHPWNFSGNPTSKLQLS